ncbi:MAG TPA: DoxX family protein [Gemmataceae bacterium]|jgi:uncharacterized membrane protein YphA (DoxX/SURF4 family)|nr:DoxX family protein [Gemmataceae bacterium]
MKKGLRIAGYVLHVLLGALFIFAGSVKQMPMSEDMAKEMAQNGLTMQWVHVIGVGEIVTGLLLIVPQTFSFGLLMASGLGGGIIATLMEHDKNITIGVVVLLVMWIGAWLRDPRTLCTCFCKKGVSP